MIKKFLAGVAMGAVFIVGVLLVTLLPVLATLYAGEHYGSLAAAGTLFVSACIIIGVAHTVFD